ncbi:hypothetical protein EVAR_76438_1 [Eumeta japonica]|uniref:Uncharacterized protein n=1 Tax=Eumeta variegata TaxID=151549 RepID=A0A4C1TBD3_EUMVA|nr:hypothetical protein EVAR_76438_1 [Eumeta japonica]
MGKKQFGFTLGRSTIDAGVELVEKIFKAWEDSQYAIGMFCDLSKMFGCVNHETLIRKLHHHGVTGHALDVLPSYLTNRVQKIDANNIRSSGSVCLHEGATGIDPRSGSILVRNEKLELVDTTVFLGLTLDNKLQWSPHIAFVSASYELEPWPVAEYELKRRRGACRVSDRD